MVNVPEYNMERHIVLVTGSGGLLGEYHCEALLELGAQVIATDISLDAMAKLHDNPIVRSSGTRILYEKMDVSNISEVKALAEKLIRDSSSPTTLLNNAALNPAVGGGGLLTSGLLEDFEEDLFLKEISVGLTGAINCSKVFGSVMAANNFGNIINIASDLAVIAPKQSLYRDRNGDLNKDNKKPVSYSTIKHAVIGLTKYLATYYNEQNVRCNALSPGGVRTEQDVRFIEELEALIPLGRMASPREYKGAIKFLCSDASMYMTGQNLIIDGGRSVW